MGLKKYAVTFQKIGSMVLKDGECYVPNPSVLVQALGSHGYHAVSYHEVPYEGEEIKHIIVGKGDPNEIEQSGEIC